MHLNLTFHPVGQGLFASGSLNDQKKSQFHWVYDCGTISRQDLIESAIENYSQCNNTSCHINLLVISHFDNDHISGIIKLLKKFSVDTLLIPYIPLWQRLILAFNKKINILNSSLLLDPIKYFTDNYNIKKIVLVSQANQNERALEPNNSYNTNFESNDLQVDSLDEENWDIEIKEASQLLIEKTKIIVLKSGGAISWKSVWEFIPYNDTNIKPLPNNHFKKKVNSLRDKLLISKSKDALDELKKIYDYHFGKSSKKRNIISLFLYAGSISDKFHNNKKIKISPSIKLYNRYYSQYYYNSPYYSNQLESKQSISIIYTGDGYLESYHRLTSLQTFLGHTRSTHPLCFQVMHHGSKNNWYQGLANCVQPAFSIFSANPLDKRTSHPHSEVWDDFYSYRPTLVDCRHQFSINVY